MAIMARYDKALQAVYQRIAAAARAARRPPNGVTLLAVSKTFPSAAIRAVHALGQRAFGENYVQEAAGKRAELADLPDLRFALIGPLQSNKTALAAEVFDRIESVDRLKVAQRLSASRAIERAPLEVLVQVNISGEATKSGVAPADALALAKEVARLPRLALRGFMGIAQPGEDIALQRSQFAVLRVLLEDTRAAGLDVDELSMGMSADLESAIAEGSTEVRIGTAIFGERATQ
ncbi:MAG TPA: YggS family pyridoxal phosphate-dependent enzyme [Casimicrobiaceae bacterium]|nr:YggS family pyridoxal phosphate-dependent enzyme [Casimicrobiaceae bacterium]